MDNKLRKFCLLVCMLVFPVIAVTGCKRNVEYHSEPRTFNTPEAMIKASDLIVTGKIVNVQTPREININLDKSTPPVEHVYTVSELKIDTVLKGNLKKDDIIEVKQLGGTYKNTKYTDVNTTYLQKDKEYMLFLVDFTSKAPNMPYSIVTPSGGCVELYSKEYKEEAINTFKPLIK